MKIRWMFGLMVVAFASLVLYVRCTHALAHEEDEVLKTELQKSLAQEAGMLKSFISDSLLSLPAKSGETLWQQGFVAARLRYKKIEWAVEYFMPHVARFVNGPPVDEIEMAESVVHPAEGFQVLEPMLFPEMDTAAAAGARAQLQSLTAYLSSVAAQASSLPMVRSNAAEAGKLQLYRILTLGITGFDAPEAKTGLLEAAASLRSLQKLAGTLGLKTDSLGYYFTQSIAAAEQGHRHGFFAFDRARFIRRYMNPLCMQWQAAMRAENLLKPNAQAILNPMGNGSLFAPDAINKSPFINDTARAFSLAKAELGRQLFEASWLSGAGKTSCATCHNQPLAFTDGQAKSAALGGGTVARNAPTLTYAALQHGQFWDMRKPDLEEQAASVIENVHEMHGSLAAAVTQINGTPRLASDFARVYGLKKVEPWMVQNALATFIRSLSPFSSRFDAWMQGNDEALTPLEVKGFNVFAGKGKCAGCHFMPLMNGVVPPAFAKMESEVLGIPATAENKTLDADIGRAALAKVPQLKGAFKIPTLRNVARTAPYMHNGAYSTLQQVMDFYNRGGGEGLGLAVGNQSLSTEPLHLNADEIKALLAFLHTLSD